MRRMFQFLAAALCFAALAGSVFAAEPIGYDADRQALVVEPYFDGYGGQIDLDFNADHSWAGLVDQSLWHYQYGSVTNPGLFNTVTTVYPGGGSSTLTSYGWGSRLGTLAPVSNYASAVTTLYSGVNALDHFYYFTEEWNTATGKARIYVRPEAGTPVQWSDLENVYFRINRGTWKKYSDVYAVEPPALPAVIAINPDTLNRKSKGKWITVYITPPQGYTAAAIDIPTVTLTLETAKTFNGKPEEKLLYTAGPCEIVVDASGTQLMVKFDRSTVSGLLDAGEATLAVSGKFSDGRRFQGSDSIRVL